MRSRKRYLFGLLVIAMGALVPSPASAVDPPTLVAAGFDSPRGVAFFQGTLVVGEAGHGGKNCIPGTPPQPTGCFGRTSQISSVNTASGAHTPLVDHLFSLAEFRQPGQGE